MPQRTTKQAVQTILGYNWDSKSFPDVTPFIVAASAIIDQAAPIASRRFPSLGWTDSLAELLERYLAAHFYCKADPTFMAKTTGGASGTMQRSSEQQGFQSTDYGRAACEMDVTGVLSAIGKRQIASMYHAGHHRFHRHGTPGGLG